MTFIIDGRRHLRVADTELEERPRKTPAAGRTSALRVWQRGPQFHGVWEMEPGVLGDVSGPETVVVLQGRATIEIEPGGVVTDVAAGDVFVIDAGETAVWTVHETVRKFYVINQEV